jgi:hypothetical protein
MVREVSLQDPLKPRTEDGHRFVSPLVELLADRGQRRSHTLQGCQADHLKLPFPRSAATVRESQKVECFRPALPRLRRRSAA